MFTVTKAQAAAIRRVFEEEGELSAAIEMRRLFPGVGDNANARERARAIAGRDPQPPPRAPAEPPLHEVVPLHFVRCYPARIT